jgi:hypothetical protein
VEGTVRGRTGILGLAIAALALGAVEARANLEGIDSTFYNNGVVGCGSPQLNDVEGCHADLDNPMVLVQIDGPSEISVDEGSGFYTVHLSETLPETFDGAGVNVAIYEIDSTSDCELDAFPQPGSDPLQFCSGGQTCGGPAGDVLSHRTAAEGPPDGSVGVFSYDFQLVNCTTEGNVRVLVAMNAFNGDEDITGEAWNKAEIDVTVSAPEPGASGAAATALGALVALGSWQAGRRSPRRGA